MKSAVGTHPWSALPHPPQECGGSLLLRAAPASAASFSRPNAIRHSDLLANLLDDRPNNREDRRKQPPRSPEKSRPPRQNPEKC